MTIIYILSGLIIGTIVGYLFAHSKNATFTAQAEATKRDSERLSALVDEKQHSIDLLSEERLQLVSTAEVLKTQVENLKASADEQRKDFSAQKADMEARHEKALANQKASYEQQLADRQRDFDKQKAEQQAIYQQQLAEFRTQQKTQMEQQSTLIREQINTASEEILKKRQDELSSSNKEQLAAILNPLHENLKQMKEAVEKSDREQNITMERLDASIKENLKQAKEVGERADKLAQALTSENKTQGNFGELRLRTLLESMGLEEGTQFEEQVTLRDEQGATLHDDEEGHRLQPDVVLHFPDERDVVIDSKMSLKAFQDYYNAETPEAKEEALARHIVSVRNHVKELSQKNYSSFIHKGRNKLDFVVMYIYSESALQLALTSEPGLWKEAYDQGVVISGSQNLYMMLRVLELTWRQVRQVENQDKIMATANELVNRVQLFYERFRIADDQLEKTQKAFEALKSTTAPTGKSIVTAANKLVKFGAQENPKRKYKLPKPEEEP